MPSSKPKLKPKLNSCWVTSANSFIAKNILEQLKGKYVFTTTTHQELDLCDSEAVNAFLKDKYFDCVIHTACVGGRGASSPNFKDTQDIFDKNYNMFENLLNNQDRFKYLINFGSGADKFNTDKYNNWYGKAKRVIALIIKEHKNMINIRLYGVWGKYEDETRFPTYCTTHDTVDIEDKLMRYINVDKLVKIVDGIIQRWPKGKREMTAGEPIRSSEFAKILNPNIKVNIKGKGEDYI